MADSYQSTAQTRRAQRPTTVGSFNPIATVLRKFQEHAPQSRHLLGLLTLLITGSILLFLTGLTVTVTVVGLIFFTPFVILTSPIWVPVGTVLFLSTAAFLSTCGFGVATVAGLSWMYRYFKGLHPPGSNRVDYARSRVYDTAAQVKDYARGYGGYLQSKVKDAAPGA